MIEITEIINRPYSGEFDERIYDIENPWNSQSWTYVKFTNEDYSEWCGVFRGAPRKAEISKNRSELLILTSDWLWRLCSKNGKVIEYEGQPEYHSLTVAPNGDFIIADYYNIYRINETLKNFKDLKSPIQMDMIEFINWENEKLIIECDEFMNWGRHLVLELSATTWNIKIKKPSNKV